MFDRPYRDQQRDALPGLSGDPEFTEAMLSLGAPINPAQHDVLRQAADFAIGHWRVSSTPSESLLADTPHEDVPAHATLEQLGLLQEIKPPRSTYDHTLIDGGTLPVCCYRLAYFQSLQERGFQAGYITMFGGQRLRLPQDGDVELFATQLYENATPWFRGWIDSELAKPRNPDDPWTRSFATEHEIAILALLHQFGGMLEHVGTVARTAAESIDPRIPPASVQAELFQVGTTRVAVLNAPAVIRVIFGTPLPAEESRPNGESCFYEWLRLADPQPDATVLSLTHNPNIYRTWLDLQKAALKAGRSDLVLEGCGAAIEAGRPYGYVLRALARITFGLCGLRELLKAAPVQQP